MWTKPRCSSRTLALVAVFTALSFNQGVTAFSASVPKKTTTTTTTSSSLWAATLDPPSSTSTAAKQRLLDVCNRLKNDNGLFVIETSAKAELQDAVSELEQFSDPPGTYYESDAALRQAFLGDWTLLCTTATDQPGLDSSKLPAFLKNSPLESIKDSIRKTLNQYLVVQQRVRSISNGNDGSALEIDRVDHVLEYRPPKLLRDVLDNLPQQLSSVDINPLSVSKSKLVLIHKASMESSAGNPTFKTKLALQSVVLNVAGTSTFFEPGGKDIAGVNVPFSSEIADFTNTGTFETTYMDDTVRISRGKQGLFEQLRVFVRGGTESAANPYTDQVVDSMDVEGGDSEFLELENDEEAESPSDVE